MILAMFSVSSLPWTAVLVGESCIVYSQLVHTFSILVEIPAEFLLFSPEMVFLTSDISVSPITFYLPVSSRTNWVSNWDFLRVSSARLAKCVFTLFASDFGYLKSSPFIRSFSSKVLRTFSFCSLHC